MPAPKKILMIKGHSAGIGDILRGSAAWRALKNRFPQADLHLLFLTKDPGYISESLIAGHHLLKSMPVIDKRTKNIRQWKVFVKNIQAVIESINPDLIIDFEPHGLRTPLLSSWIGLKYGITTVGINEIPLRGLFYNLRSVSTKSFGQARKLEMPLEYTCRDFVVLSALGIEREGTPIELAVTPEGEDFRRTFREKYAIPDTAGILGINIGCGTSDAGWKKPDLHLLARFAGHLQQKYNFTGVLTGAPFEKEINQEFMNIYRKDYPYPVYDLAGETDLLKLAGLISSCNLFVSSDSGPYHMAVALRVPTIALFVREHRVHYHDHPWVKCEVFRTEEDMDRILCEAEDLMRKDRK